LSKNIRDFDDLIINLPPDLNLLKSTAGMLNGFWASEKDIPESAINQPSIPWDIKTSGKEIVGEVERCALALRSDVDVL